MSAPAAAALARVIFWTVDVSLSRNLAFFFAEPNSSFDPKPKPKRSLEAKA